jgi:hypothetical protein
MVYALPIALLTRAKIDRDQKRIIIGIFTLGAIAILASFARILSTVVLATTLDRPTNWIMLPLFTALEVNIAITSASLPALSPLIRSTLRRVAKHSGGNGWLSRFDEPYGEHIDNPVKPFHNYDQDGSSSNGEIQIQRVYGVSENESAFGNTPINATVRAASPYETDEPVKVYGAPKSMQNRVQPARLHPREATTNTRGDMSLAEMLRTTGPDDPENWSRARRGGGKARELLGV